MDRLVGRGPRHKFITDDDFAFPDELDTILAGMTEDEKRDTLIAIPVHRLFALGPLPDAAWFPTWGDGRWMYLWDGHPGAAPAGELVNQAKVLAEAIPAMSRATGRNALTRLQLTERNIDMQALFRNHGWPDRSGDTDWKHGDYIAPALYYVQDLYDTMIELGGLQ